MATPPSPRFTWLQQLIIYVLVILFILSAYDKFAKADFWDDLNNKKVVPEASE